MPFHKKKLDSDRRAALMNTIMLYLLTAAKIIFPLLTLPYLTRVLSKDCYGVVAYVKSYIVYTQLIVDFGFMLSSVKDIVNAGGDKRKIGEIAGHTIFAKLILSLVALVVTVIVCCVIPILKEYFLYTILSYIVVFLSCFLADFLFRGIEKMHYISIVFVVMQGISTALTFVFVKSDGDILWIPVLSIVASLFAIVLTWVIVLVRLKYRVYLRSVKESLRMIRESFFYFISNMATTAFGALNTLLIGIFITDLAQVAYWSVCMTVVSAIQSLYAPIINGVYPYMIKTKKLSYIHKILLFVMPVLFIGGAVGFFLSKFVLRIVGGAEYVEAYWLLRALIPLLIVSFPAMLYGWPTLGSIQKVKQTSATTILSAAVQVLGLLVLALVHRFDLLNIAFLRTITELVLLGSRMWITYKNRRLFDGNSSVSGETCPAEIQ